MKLEIFSHEPVGPARPRPLLFVHGLWVGAWCWQEHFFEYFTAHGYAVHALSLRGHGGSEGRQRLRWTRLSEYVDDVAQAVAQLPSPPVLIGHSNGGLVVQKYLETHTAPAAVLLASVPSSGLLWPTLNSATQHPWQFLVANLTMSLYPLVSTPQLARATFFSDSMPEDQVRAYQARMSDESFLAFLDGLLFNRPRPSRVNTPILVLGAANDRLIDSPRVRATARAYGTQAEIFAGTAHGMMLEAGWQAVADRMLAWLEKDERR